MLRETYELLLYPIPLLGAPRCQAEASSHVDPARSRKFALFLSELFVHLKVPEKSANDSEKDDGETSDASSGDTKTSSRRDASLADSVHEVLAGMCNEDGRKDNDNLRAVADALKVGVINKARLILFFTKQITCSIQISGGALEEHEKSSSGGDDDSGSTPKLDALLATVAELAKADSVSAAAKEELVKIAGLRKDGWPEQKVSLEAENDAKSRRKVTLEAPPEMAAKAEPAPKAKPQQAKKSGESEKPVGMPKAGE